MVHIPVPGGSEAHGRRTVAIAVAVVVHDGLVLVGRRAASAEDAAGCHEFPGGKVEPGETPEAAAARECLEETGITVRIGRRLDAASAPSRSGPIGVIFFEAAPIEFPPPREPFAWTRIADLPALSFPPANAGVLAVLAGTASSAGAQGGS